MESILRKQQERSSAERRPGASPAQRRAHPARRPTLPVRGKAGAAALFAVDVELEVLVLHFLVLAVGADRQDGGADLVGQGLVALAHGNALTLAEVLLVGEVRTHQGEA